MPRDGACQRARSNGAWRAQSAAAAPVCRGRPRVLQSTDRWRLAIEALHEAPASLERRRRAAARRVREHVQVAAEDRAEIVVAAREDVVRRAIRATLGRDDGRQRLAGAAIE